MLKLYSTEDDNHLNIDSPYYQRYHHRSCLKATLLVASVHEPPVFRRQRLYMVLSSAHKQLVIDHNCLSVWRKHALVNTSQFAFVNINLPFW